MTLSKTTLANRSSDCCWAVIALLVESANFPFQREISNHSCISMNTQKRNKCPSDEGSPELCIPRSSWSSWESCLTLLWRFNWEDKWNDQSKPTDLLWMSTGTVRHPSKHWSPICQLSKHSSAYWEVCLPQTKISKGGAHKIPARGWLLIALLVRIVWFAFSSQWSVVFGE